MTRRSERTPAITDDCPPLLRREARALTALLAGLGVASLALAVTIAGCGARSEHLAQTRRASSAGPRLAKARRGGFVRRWLFPTLACVIAAACGMNDDDSALTAVRSEVEALCRKFPLYPETHR